MDTVEPGRHIVPVVKNGFVQSDGTTILGADNKFALAAILNFVQNNVSQPNYHTRPLELVFTASEESGNYGAIGFDKTKLTATQGYIFDVGLKVGTIISASPYYLQFNCTIKGKSAHAANRKDSIPVISSLLQLIQAIERLRSNELLVNIGLISGGSARNTIMGEVTFNGEIRCFEKNIFEASKLTLEQIFSNPGDVPLDWTVKVENPGYRHDAAKLNSLANQLTQALGSPCDIQDSYGCSDANIFNENAKLQIINLGDGVIDAHTTSERVAVKDLDRLNSLLATLCEGTF
jgi:tripeptide aminopeptidase